MITSNNNVRDLSLRNINSSASISSLPTGMRNVTLTWNNASLNIPTVSITGDMTLNSGNAITQSGSVGANSLVATAENGINLTNSANTISSIEATNNTSGNITFVTSSTPLSVSQITQNGSGTIAITISPSGSGQIQLNGDISSNGGSITINNPIALSNSITISSNNGAINLLNTINGAKVLTINAGNSGDITFNGNIGSSTLLQGLTISNARNVTNNASMNVVNFTQSAGSGTTAFGSSGLTASGVTSISTNNVTGKITINSFSLGTNLANLTGTINGGSGRSAIATINFLNTISSGTHFFNGIDMFSSDTPSNVSPVSTSLLPQIALADTIAQFNGYIGFNAYSSEFLDLIKELNQWQSCSAITEDIIICK